MHFLKFVTLVLTIVIISSNLIIIKDYLDLYNQKYFFEEFANYNYLYLFTKYSLDNEEFTDYWAGEELLFEDDMAYHDFLQNKLYLDLYDEANPIISIELLKGSNYLITNKNNMLYLSEQFENIDILNIENDFYCLYPENIDIYKLGFTSMLDFIDDMENYIKGRYGTYATKNIDYFTYNNNIEVVSFGAQGDSYVSDILLNPIFFVNNLDLKKEKQDSHSINIIMEELKGYYPSKESIVGRVLTRSIMFDYSEEDFNNYLKVNGYDNDKYKTVVTNVIDDYNNRLKIKKYFAYISFIFTVLIISLEIITINTLIRLEYKANAIQIALKKVMGYTIFQRYKSIFIMTIIVSGFAGIAAIITGKYFGLYEIYLIILASAILLIIEIGVSLYNIKKFEKLVVNKVLKGGNV